MIRLLYNGGDKKSFVMTQNPITRPQSCPMPTGIRLEDAKNEVERQVILKHPNYSESEVVCLKPGLNEFENEEQAEYLYKIMGDPEEGGSVDIGGGRYAQVKNENLLFEVDEKGEEIKDHFWKKYRKPTFIAYKTAREEMDKS